jgi:hypothetical protein
VSPNHAHGSLKQGGMFPVWVGPAGDIGADGQPTGGVDSRGRWSAVRIPGGACDSSFEVHRGQARNYAPLVESALAWPAVQRARPLPQTDRRGGQEVLRCVSVCVVGHAPLLSAHHRRRAQVQCVQWTATLRPIITITVQHHHHHHGGRAADRPQRPLSRHIDIDRRKSQ